MLPYQSLITFEERVNIPRFRFIAGRLIALIQQGTIKPGTILPGTRQLAQMICVHRNTVTSAYNELISQGWVEALNRKGFRVIPELPIAKPRSFHPEKKYTMPLAETSTIFSDSLNLFKFTHLAAESQLITVNDGFPDVTLAPVEEIMKEYRKCMKPSVLKNLSMIKGMAGVEVLRQATARFLNQTRGLNIESENVMITRGAQMAIYTAAALLINPGDEIVVSEPNYFMADDIFRNRGAVINRVPVDEDGMDVDELERLLQQRPIKLLYVIPHHHHPTTVTLSASRRMKLLNLIKQYKVWVIEDDYDYDFHYQNSPILPLASADDSGRIIYIGSYTKLLGPTFRIGYMINGKDLIDKATNYRRLMDLGGDAAMETVMASLIESGELSRHIKRVKKIYHQRCDATSALISAKLPEIVSFTKPQGGMALWLKFANNYPLATVLPKMARANVLMAGTSYYKNQNEPYNHLRFGFASLTGDELERVILAMCEATGA